MDKRLIFIFLFVISMVSVNAYLLNQQINFTTTCEGFDCSKLNLTILFPNTTLFVDNQSMTNQNAYAYYQITPVAYGTYTYYLYDGGNHSDGTFEVTYYNRVLSTSASIMYVGLFGVLFFIFIMNLFFINKLPNQNAKDEEGKLLSISWLKYLRGSLWFVEYILFVAIIFIASNLAFVYLNEQLVANILFVVYRITFSLSPLIVIMWFVWIFVKIKEDKKFWRGI